MFAAPAKVDRIQKTIYRTFRLISDEKARKPLGQRSVIFSRVIGVCYVAGCLFILAHMQLQVGKISEKNLPVWTGNSQQQKSDDSALHQTVRRIVQPLAHKYVGLVVATIADDEHDVTGFGRIHLHSDQPPDGDTLFEIGSISKVFTGILLADMIAKNTLALDTTITSLLPSLSIDPDSPKHSIRLGHLVTHTSGLQRMPAHTFNLSQIWAVTTAGDSYRSYTEEHILETVSKKTWRRRVPGEHFAYSNAGFGLLGFLLSKQTGRDYHQMVQTVIADPLGLKDTGVLLDDKQQSRLATGYRSYLHVGPYYLAQRAENWEFPNCFAGAGALRSTADDMLIFLAANMGRQKSSITPVLVNSQRILFTNDSIQIGMGWFHKKLSTSGATIIWHNGGTGGYSSFLGFTENGRFGVSVLSNSTKGVDHIGYKILETLLSEW